MKKLLVLGAFLVLGYMSASAQSPASSKPQTISVTPSAAVASDVMEAPVPVATDNTKKKEKSCSDSKSKSSCSGHEKKSCCSSKSSAKAEATKKEESK